MPVSVCKDLLRLTNLSHFLIVLYFKKVKGYLFLLIKDLLLLTVLFSLFFIFCVNGNWPIFKKNLNFHGININLILTSYSHPVLYKGIEPLFSARKAGVLTVRRIEH